LNPHHKTLSVLVYAPVALVEAEEELERSRSLWEARADQVLIEHHAYLAKQKTAIARETANLNRAQVEIERAEPERQRVSHRYQKTVRQRAELRAEQPLKRRAVNGEEAERQESELKNLLPE
jgi:hypothetical protein